jgi:hypothetical protein
MKKPKKTTKKATRKARESPKKIPRKAAKTSRKPGRPRKTLAQLKMTGGYDRNPGRLLKRMGVVQQKPSGDPAEVAKWDEYERRFGKLGEVKHRPYVDVRPAKKKQKTDAETWDEVFKDTDRRKISQAYYEACQLDDRGEHEAADRLLLAVGETREIVEQRRRYLDQKAKNPTNVT